MSPIRFTRLPLLSRLACGLAAATALSAALTVAASAHAVLTPDTAVAGQTWRGAVRIGHGCEGTPTRLVRVTMPQGVVSVRPKAKNGWLIETIWAPYPAPISVHGKTVGEGVKAIIWKGASLPDHMYDEFEFTARIQSDAPARDGKLVFPVYQECEKGAFNWTEVAAPGADAHALKAPAPSLKLAQATPAKGAHGQAAQAAATQGHDHGAQGAHAAAHSYLTVSGGWTRATPAGAKVAGAYIAVANGGEKADALVGGRFDVAGRVEIHDMTMVDGVMRMRKLDDGLAIPAGGAVELRPGGLHIMLMDLKQPLKQGETISGVLTFRNGGEVKVTLPVEAAGSPGPGKAGKGHGGGKDGHGEGHGAAGHGGHAH